MTQFPHNTVLRVTWFSMGFLDSVLYLVEEHEFRFGLLRMRYVLTSKKQCQIDDWCLDLRARHVKLVSFLDRW